MAMSREERLLRKRERMRRDYEANPQKFRDRSNAHRKAHPKKARSYKLVGAFGITQDDYEMKLVRQRGACAICGSWDAATQTGVFHVDHHHDTGQVRNLLCSHCNHAVGKVRESPVIAQSLASYLVKWSK